MLKSRTQRKKKIKWFSKNRLSSQDKKKKKIAKDRVFSFNHSFDKYF